MSLSIRTNIASLNAQRNLASTQSALETSMARLSSGYRITKAGDDAAGLGIGTKLESQIRSYNQAVRNTNDGVSVVQTAEAGLDQSASMLTRLRELAMQSASDGIGDSERAYVDTEAQQLLSELDRIAQTTQFNGVKLLDGSATTLDFHVGVDGTSNDVISLTTLNATTAAATAGAAPVVGAGNVGRAAAAAAYESYVTTNHNYMLAFDVAWPAAIAAGASSDEAINWANAFSGAFEIGYEVGGGDVMAGPTSGAAESAGLAAVASVAAGGTGSGAVSSIISTAYQTYAASVAAHNGDQSYAGAATQAAVLPLVQAAGVTTPPLITAAADRLAMSLLGAVYTAAGGTLGMPGDPVTMGTPAASAALGALGFSSPIAPGSAGGLGVAGLSLASKTSALSALGTVDAALDKVSTARSALGATGNRLQAAITNIQATSQSLSAANSRIKDVDVAEETSQLARNQILSQAAVSVLAQANQQPQLALKLLG